MANTDKQHRGASEVEQSKSFSDIADQHDDIPEARPAQDYLDQVRDKLDRGEELYTGFGFDNDREDGELLADRLEENSSANRVATTHTTERDQVNTTNHPVQTQTTGKVIERMEVPEDTRIVIGPQDGEVEVIEREGARRQATSGNPANYYRVNHETVGHHTNNVIDEAPRHLIQQVPADYELSDVYYSGNKKRGLYEPETTRPATTHRQIDALPIKRHYKNLNKANKRNIPWVPIAIGVAAVIGISTFVLGEEDDGPFWV